MSKQKQLFKEAIQSKSENAEIVEVALHITYAMMAKGLYQYPLTDFDIDRYAQDAARTAKRLIEAIKKECKE